MQPDVALAVRPVSLVAPGRSGALRSVIARTGAITRHNATLLLREPGPLASRLIMPLAFLALLHPLYERAQGQAAGIRQATIATLVMFSLLAVSIVGGSILSERIWRTWERIRATPVHPAELLLGKAIPGAVALIVQQALIVGFAVTVLGLAVARPLLLVAAVAAWTLALLGIGAAVGAAARSLQEMSAATDIGGMILTSLGGALVPLAEMPGWVRHVAPASPGYWAISALDAALRGNAAAVMRACAVLTGFALACGVLAALRASHGAARSASF